MPLAAYVRGRDLTRPSSIALTGFVVLGGHTSVSNPTANFQNAFAGSGSAGGNGTANALVKITFAYAGFANAFQVTNEIRVGQTSTC